MDDRLKALCEKLDAISDAMGKVSASEQRLSQTHNWQAPPISPQQLNLLPAYIAEAIRSRDVPELDDVSADAVEDVSAVLDGFQTDVLSNIYGTPLQGSVVTLTTFSYVSTMLSSTLGWAPGVPSLMPSNLLRKMAKIDRELNSIMPDKADIENKMATIIQANEAAEELPTTLQELKTAQQEMRSISSTASETIGKIKKDHDTGEKALAELEAAKEEGNSLVKQVGEAYRLTTTVGLAASFQSRAVGLNVSVYVWVVCLLAGLVAAIVIGYYRLEAMREALTAVPFDASRVWVQLILSLVGIAAPVWFAWIATKQIGQRFRLAEDYAFKAAVAKAYEGYRREAVRIDPEFEKALFASALKRLDEAPLRLVELPSHGSPFHELANSRAARALIDRAKGKSAKDHPRASNDEAPAAAQAEA